jgi:hypothetical protein
VTSRATLRGDTVRQKFVSSNATNVLEDGPLRTGELKERLYPEFEHKFSTPDSMWESIRRYFDEIPGIEQIGRGKYDGVPEQVRQN